jgi:hypothetical protein
MPDIKMDNTEKVSNMDCVEMAQDWPYAWIQNNLSVNSPT